MFEQRTPVLFRLLAWLLPLCLLLLVAGRAVGYEPVHEYTPP